MNLIKIIIVCLLFQIATIKVDAQQGTNNLPKGAEEAGFITTYSNYRINIPTYYYNDSLYIPLIQILSFLKIYFIATNGINNLSGYLISKDSTFEIDFTNNKAKFNKRKIEFTKKEYFKTKFDIYILPSLLYKIFGLNARIIQSALIVNIESKVDLPIILQDKRKKKYSYLDSKDLQNKVLPLIYGKKWSLLNGGIVNYNLGTSYYLGNMNYQYGASFGLQVLGGDVQFNTTGLYSKFSQYNSSRNYWRWRYDFDNNWLSNITFGNIYPSNFRASSFNHLSLYIRQYSGIQISNEKIQHNYNFTTMIIEDKLAPDWQVELYVNGQLFAQQKTDALGYYRFNLPVKYGNNNITLKFYGPNGELASKAKVISVPSDFLSPGKIKYTIGGGKMVLEDKYIGTADLAVGITNWMTNSIKVLKVDKDKDFTILNHNVVRFGGNLTLNTDYSPNKVLSGGLSLWSDDYGTYNISYSKFNGYSELNRSGGNDAIYLNVSLPRIGALPINVMLRSSRIETQSSVNYIVNSDMRMYLSSFDFGVRYSAYLNQMSGQKNYLRQDINPTINFNFSDKPKFLDFLDNTRFTIGANYNTTINRFTYANLSIQQSIFRNLNFNAMYRKDLIYGHSSLRLTLQMNLSQFRSSTLSNYSESSSPNYSQSLSGMLGFNPNNMEFNFDNSQSYGSIGTGAANFRFFIDKNDNDKFDKGEYLIHGVSVRVSMGQVKMDSKGSAVVYSLPVGQRINVKVNLASIKSPLWMPKYKEFAMIADPNSFKTIDVPCFASGVVEGEVVKDDSAKSGQAGVRVHFKNKLSGADIPINVFSDGSFYKMGIPPGEYNVYVDSLQLSLLEDRTVPKSKTIKIVSKMEGDFVSGINFVLKSTNKIDSLSLKKSLDSTNANKIVKKNLTPLYLDSILAQQNIKAEENAPIIDSASQASVKSKKQRHSSKKSDSSFVGFELKKTLHFKNATDFRLTRKMRKYFDKAVLYLKAHPNAFITIVGHTDSYSGLKQTQNMSEKRANEARYYIISKNISKKRVFANGLGCRYPIARNVTLKGRQKNRRIEIQILTRRKK